MPFSLGPFYPATRANLSNAGTNESAEAWSSITNIGADDAAEASITAATYDSPDISQLIVASNFGFSSVQDRPIATINGITVEVDRRSIIAGSGRDFRVQLARGTAFANLVGDNKATATTWPSTSGVATYGSSTDLWGTTWLVSDIIDNANFAVMLSCTALIANADVGVDYIRVTINVDFLLPRRHYMVQSWSH